MTNRGLLHIMKYLQSEFRRQTQRQHSKIESQSNTEGSTLTDNAKSESINFEMNRDDSLKSTSTSFPSVVDLEQDFDNGCQDFSKYKYLPQNELVNMNSFNVRDSGYNTISHSVKLNRIDKYHQNDRKSEQMSNDTANHGDHNMMPCSLSYRDDLLKTSERLIERQFKKNKNYNSTSNSISQVVSPQTYRSTRFNSRNRQQDPNKIRRNSLPDNEYATQPNNFTNHDVDVSSECVVVVDNINNDVVEPSLSQDKLSNAQSNNNSSAYRSLRPMKSGNFESYTGMLFGHLVFRHHCYFAVIILPF